MDVKAKTCLSTTKTFLLLVTWDEELSNILRQQSDCLTPEDGTDILRRNLGD
jgi:hypothetical protein